ncbi:hypothetical protein KIN20_009087 [Parelaphostrongylus tenuis]|uniref:Uncharacterized protein n=1 Tax=Parelaphostrongylus tenuis TaxID=148309 RepID=A0AAD5M7Q1_PARTN|nr:hypothetical protein KIN20_009087 [Parelaphostrongylus tenuis]
MAEKLALAFGNPTSVTEVLSQCGISSCSRKIDDCKMLDCFAIVIIESAEKDDL